MPPLLGCLPHPRGKPAGPWAVAPSNLCLEGEGLRAGEGLGWVQSPALFLRGCGGWSQ